MRAFHLNLASRPYRDYRPVYAVVVAMSLAIAFLMLNNVDTYYRYISETQATRAAIARLEQRTAAEHERAAAADRQIASTNVRALEIDTKFVNSQLAERAFSWSELLERLEAVLPDDVRVHNVTPVFTRSAYVHLEFTCDAKSQAGMLDTIIRFQRDPHFANPFPHSQNALAVGGYSFTFGVDFKPTVARAVEK